VSRAEVDLWTTIAVVVPGCLAVASLLAIMCVRELGRVPAPGVRYVGIAMTLVFTVLVAFRFSLL